MPTQSTPKAGKAAGRGRGRASDPVGSYLRSLEREQLIALFAEEAAENPGLASALEVRAQLAGAGRLSIATIEKLLVRATSVRTHLKAAETARLARQIDEVAHLLELIVKSDSPEPAIELAENALHRISGLWVQVDDTKGLILAVNARFQRVHLNACLAARPDPALLARRLYELEVHGASPAFARAAERYADVLGPAGLEAYRKLLAPVWARIPAVGPGARWHEGFSAERHTISNAMAALSRAMGDVDREIEVERRDLRSPERFLAIAMLCEESGRPDEAVSWAEAGIRAFDQEADELRVFLMDKHLAESRIEDVMRMAWGQFAKSPDAETFRALRRYGIKGGVWADWHERAVEHARRAAELASAADGSLVPGVARTKAALNAGAALVGVFLADDRLEEALSAARRYGCGPAQWLDLAGRCETALPDDAVAIYQARVKELLQLGDPWCESAVDVLARLRDLMALLDRTREFEEYARGVRESNARKRAFTYRFDLAGLVPQQHGQAGWSASGPARR